MGQVSIPVLVEMLKSKGIRTEKAFPPEQISRVTEPVAAISLEETDSEKHTTTVLVEIFGPADQGGAVCQDKGAVVCAALESVGGVCKQGRCEFLAKANLFRVPVKAVFQEDKQFTVAIGTSTLRYLTALSMEQTKSSSAESLDGSAWIFTLEEFFPWGKESTLGLTEPFELNVYYAGYVERYESCRLTERKRIPEALGMRQIRKGKASNRILTADK